MRTPFWPTRRSKKALSSQAGRSKKSLQRSKLDAALERLEERCVLAAFTPGNIAVIDLAAATTNTTGSILELSPSVANQSPVQTISIASTGTNAVRFSDSGTSSFLSDSNDGSLLAFSAYNTTTTSGNLASLNPRAVGTLNSSGTFNLATTYNVSSADLTAGNQTRSATSLDDTHWFITDKGGLYTNSATTPSLSTNILDARAFGGTVYISSTKATAGVSTVASPTATSLVGLPGLAGDGAIQDFYLIQSGTNGSTYDVLYTLDQNSSSATINKFSLVGGTWVSNGSSTFGPNAEAMIAENDGGGGAYLFLATTNGTANNSVVRLTDTAGYNQPIAISSSNDVTLYTDTANDLLKSLAFVPAAATAPTVSNPTSANIGIASATLGGTVTSTGSPPVTGYGVVYSLTSVNANPTIGGTGVTQVVGSGSAVFAPFTVGVAGLQNTSQYSFAAYAINGAGTAYSSVSTFTTQNANPPTIDTPTATSITNSSATLGGTVESDGGATVTKTGVVYALTSVNGNPQLGGNSVTEVDTTSPVDSGAFTVSATGLSPGAGYTFEAFATNSSGTTYTTATSFTTLAPPTVVSPTFTDVTGSSAIVGANVASNGGSTITKFGIVYALTSANSNPQLGGTGVTEVDATGTPGVFTVPVVGLSASTGYTFEAFAANAIGTTYTPATSFTTAAANIITAWTFPTTAAPPDNSPAPTYGTGTATTLGMTNNLTNENGTGNTASDDVLSTSGTTDTNFTENLWRVRGTPNNGWAQSAPQYSQGIELDTSTVGYSNIVFAFNWYSTTQGIRDLQVQYNTGGGWVNYQGPSPTGTFIATSNDYYNAGLSPVNPTIYINLSSVAAANNNPDLGIRLVSAYDSTGTLESASPSTPYASATSTANNIVPYNNNSGNWRFGNLIFYGNSTTTSTTIAANPPGGQSPGQNVTFTATVTPSGGTQYPSGTVTFYDGTTQLGTTQTVMQVGSTNVGTASITLSTLSPGVHSDITAQYTPDDSASTNGLIASGSSMSLVAGDPTDNPITYAINAPQATGVDVSPVVGQPFTGVVATFSDGTNTSPVGMSASITWGNGQTTPGSIAFLESKNETNINGQTVDVILFTVTGTDTYTAAGTYPLSVTITDANNNSTTVTPTARVAYAPLHVTAGSAINAVAGTPVNQTVATFTDPGLVANLASLGISDPTTQFTSTINWGDGASSAGTITYNSGTQVFSVVGSHTYSHTGPYNVSVGVTPLTVAVERMDSSDPTNLNVVGDENSDGLTDSPSPDFIDQYVIGAANQSGPLYTTSLPTVATPGGPEAFTNSSYSESEGELTLSTNGQYLVTAGYDDTVSAWAPQQTKSAPSVIPRNIARIDGNSNVDTSTNIANAYDGDNNRGVVTTDGTQFWSAGQATDTTDYVHYVTYDATTSTQITAAPGPKDPQDVEIFNGQLYESNRSTSVALAGIYQVGTGLPTAPTTQTLFIELPQSLPLDVNNSGATLTAFSFWMADLPTNPNSINGVNVCYVADGEMGIARYDYEGPTLGWQFSYYIDQTGAFKDSVYTVNSDGSVTPTASFNSTDPAPFSGNPNADYTKEGGVKGLTGRIVNGQVQLFATSGFGTDYQPHPGGSLVEVTDPETLTVPGNFLNTTDAITTLATNPTTDPSELTGVAFSPTAVVTSSAQVSPASPTITTTPSPNVTLGTTAPTLSDSAVLANGYNETGSLLFTLTGPNNFSYTQTVPISGNGTYTASDVLPTTGTVAGTYTWQVSYAGDANNNPATDNGAIGQLGDVFYIDMENHNLTQPSGLSGSPEQLLGNPAAPYLNSLMTPGNPNAAQASWASDYYNVLYNNPAASIHPSEPNYVWQESGSNYGIANDDDPYANNGNPNPNLNTNIKLIAATGNNPANLTGLLQAAGISWKSYQEDIDMVPTSGSVNQPGSNALTGTVANQSQWTVPTTSFSGTSAAYTNAYNGSHQYNFAVKHDGQLFFTDTNGGTLNAPNFSPSNPEAQYYAPLQQLQTDLTDNTVSRYNLITPDQYNDMHSALSGGFTYQGTHYTGDQSAVAAGDNFLSQIIPMIEASQAYKNNGAIVIWFDETENGNTTQYAVPEIIISPLAKGNAYNSTQVYTHSSDIKTLQELFGVSAPGGGFLADANTPGTNDLANMFKPEQTVVSPASPTIGATAGAPVVIGTGTPLTASAALAGGYFETGTITFTLYNPNGVSVYTDAVTVNGNGTYDTSSGTATGSAVPTRAGTYQWVASYSGDANNTAASTVNGETPEVAVGAGATVVGNSLYLVGGNSTNDQVNVTPTGTSNTGSTGVEVDGKLAGSQANAVYSQAFTTIYIVGFGGNEHFNVASSITIATVVTAGDGNDHVQLGGGNNTVTLGGGNDQVTVGDGNNQIQLGGGNDQVEAGNGNNSIVVGNGNDQVGAGDGKNVIVAGNGNDQIQAGNGDNLVVGGLGHHTIEAGNGKNILIDGSVQLTPDVLEQVLSDFIANDITDAANLLTPAVTFNTSNANTLTAGTGFDWFWATYAKDHTNRKPTDLLN